MPVNPGIDYKLAEEEFHKAKTTSEKIKALENMYATCPGHKGAEKLLKEIKSKLSKFKERLKHETAKRSSYSISVKKEGAATISLVGISNSGKSTILQGLTGVKQIILEYEYTTKLPEVAIMDYNGIKLQIIEIPAIFEGYSQRGNGPAFLSIARNSDLIIIILDGLKPLGEQLNLIESELKNSLIELDGETKGSIKGIPCLIVINKKFKRPKTKHKIVRLENLRLEIWKNLNLIYVYTKTPGKERDFPPVALKKGSSVEDLALKVHKDFVKKFNKNDKFSNREFKTRYAILYGRRAKNLPHGIRVGYDYILKEEDIIELHISKV